MTPLQLRIMLGQEDPRLLEHIAKLESFGAGVSPGERETLAMAYERLDIVTTPDGSYWTKAQRS